MKLTKEQFIYYVNALDKMYQEEDEITSAIGVIEWKPIEWINKFADFLFEMCEFPENKQLGETELDWFCYETCFGRDENYNYIEYGNLATGICRVRITSAEDLAKFLEVAEDVEWAATI